MSLPFVLLFLYRVMPELVAGDLQKLDSDEKDEAARLVCFIISSILIESLTLACSYFVLFANEDWVKGFIVQANYGT